MAKQLIDQILNPWYVTGFADGESAFVVSIQKNLKMKTG
jgi:hypothetical protein